jgi:lipopolysaccharide exporter
VIRKGKDGFLGSAAILTASAALTTGAMVLMEPITSRFFGPESYGMAAVFASVVQVMATIGCLRYEVALVIPEADDEAASLLGLGGVIALTVTVVTACLTAVFGRTVLAWLNAGALTPVLWALPVQVAFMSTESLLRHWNIRHRRFRLVGVGQLLVGVPAATAEVCGGAAGFRTGQNLVALRAVAQVVAPLYLLYRLARDDLAFVRRHVTLRGLLDGARRYVKFPMFDAGAVLLNLASWHAPVVLLVGFFGASVGGLFTKALYLLYLPTVLVGESVGQVFLQHSAVARAAGKDLAELVNAVSCRMISLGVLPFAAVAVVGPSVFSAALGARWAEAGIYAGILAPWMFAVLVLSSIRFLFNTLEIQEWNLATTAVLFGVRVASLLIGGVVLKDVYLTLALFSGTGTVVILWRCAHLMRTVGLPLGRPARHLARTACAAAPGLALLAALRWWVCAPNVLLLAGALVVIAAYLGLVAHRDPDLRRVIAARMRRPAAPGGAHGNE